MLRLGHLVYATDVIRSMCIFGDMTGVLFIPRFFFHTVYWQLLSAHTVLCIQCALTFCNSHDLEFIRIEILNPVVYYYLLLFLSLVYII